MIKELNNIAQLFRFLKNKQKKQKKNSPIREMLHKHPTTKKYSLQHYESKMKEIKIRIQRN